MIFPVQKHWPIYIINSIIYDYSNVSLPGMEEPLFIGVN